MEYVDLVIYDDVLPSPTSPFRTLEYGHYLTFFERSGLVSLEAYHHGFAHQGFGDLASELTIPEAAKSKILRTWEDEGKVVPRLAYVTFLGNAWTMLPHFEQRRLPFILQLYPGGSFEPNVPASDERLRRVVHSPLCRRVIATQSLTRDHLLGPIGCDPAKVELIYGGVFDSRVDFDFDRNKCVFGRDKDTIDLCFVAYRYTQDMGQKGYDQFVEVARLLAPADPRLRFHVVGDYSPDDLPLGDTAVRFTFHGSQPSSFFATFYPRMDVILSANRPVGDLAGVFDGFPTGACIEAGFRGVLNCISDPLSLNVAFEDRRDILLIDRVAQRTATLLAALFAEPQRLYALAHANWRRFREVFDVDQQLWQRTRVIAAELLQQEMLIARPAAPPSSLNASAIAAARAQATYSEGRHDALLAEYRKLASGLAEATTYWEQRHDALLAEYRKLESGFAVAKMHWEQQQDAAQMAGDIISGREQPDAPAGPLGIRVLLGMLAKRLVPAVTLRLRRGRPGWLGL